MLQEKLLNLFTGKNQPRKQRSAKGNARNRLL
jgi:hypothetical protein